MAKKVYVNGSILIKTSDFKYEGAGALFGIPDGAETIETNDVIDGLPFLVIDDERPQSMFNEYYAKGVFTTLYSWSYYLNSNCQKAYDNFNERKSEIECLLEGSDKLSILQQELTYKLLLLNVVTLFDAFVCETIVSKITSSKECFDAFYEKFYDDLTDNKKRHFDKLGRGELEREVLMSQLMKSFANVERVNHIYKKVWDLDFDICEGYNLQDWFNWRHRIIHRNGREKDGTYHQFSHDDVKKALVGIDTAVNHIMTTISKL
jgi:hypothetical protein